MRGLAGTGNSIRRRSPAETRQNEQDYNRPFTRSFDRQWDVVEDWPFIAVAPLNSWQKGTLQRGAQPQFAVTWFGSGMYDPSQIGTWRTEL
jgi:hypothetical protein